MMLYDAFVPAANRLTGTTWTSVVLLLILGLVELIDIVLVPSLGTAV